MLKRAACAVVVACLLGAGSLAANAAVQDAARPPVAAPAKARVTFNKDVAPVVFAHCTGCHRPGEIAPFSMVTYKDARPWAKAIREKVLERGMPPWLADPHYGKFSNDRRLTQQEIDTIVAWVDGGALQGDPKDLPPPPEYAEGWNIGKPDIVFSMPEEYDVPAEGVVEYQHFTVPTNFTEDRWVQAAEIRAGNRAVVHHVIVYVQDPKNPPRPPLGIQLRVDQAIPPREPDAVIAGKRVRRNRLGTLLVGTAPGDQYTAFAPGTAKHIPAGANLIFQVHYTPNGAVAKDRSSVGLVFAKQPPQHEIRTVAVMNARFVIPPGDPNYKVESEATFTQDAEIWGLFPHMHVRGKNFEYRLVYPDGKSAVLLSVPKYDFNWQTGYNFAEPLKVPKGSRLECTAYFDNSPSRAGNPDSTKEVRWGDQTWEEMMIGWASYSVTPAAAQAASAAATPMPVSQR